MDTMSVNGKAFNVIKLLGKGKAVIPTLFQTENTIMF